MQHLLQTTVNFGEISAIRRHIYFYALLVLGAAVLSGLWKQANAAEMASTEEIVRIQRIVDEAAQ
jgi:hypothetical protein